MVGIRDGVPQIANQFGNRQFLGSCDVANGPAVTRVWRNVNRLEQQLRTRVIGVRDEVHTHPGLDGFVLPVDVTRGSACAVAEEECSGDRQTETQNR